MLRFKIDLLLRAKGIKEGYTFLKGNGFSQMTATKFSNSQMTVLRLVHVEKICELFNCTPNDLLEWSPNKGVKDISKHPLFPLKTYPAFAILKALQALHGMPQL